MSETAFGYSDLCLGGCGKKVLNRLQLCAQCRKRECTRCKKVFFAKNHLKDVCNQCLGKKKTLAAKYSDQQGWTNT